MKTLTYNSHLTFKESTTLLSSKRNDTSTGMHREEIDHQNPRDKAFYQLIKDTYTLHVRRKKSKSIKMVCTTKFKNVGSKKIGIMKIHNLEEIKY